MPLLDGLGEVNWSALHHAYGPADDVPDLLRALIDTENAPLSLRTAAKGARRDVRDQVEWTLWGNVFHQGSRWQVTAGVVPFLVELLRDGPNDDRLRRFLIRYLHHLAIGYPEDVFPAVIDPAEAFRAVGGMSDPGGEPDYDNHDLAAIWARDSYLAVERAVDTIAPFMHAEDEDTALEAVALVASFPRCAPTTVPLLRDVARARPDQRAAHAVVSLAQLAPAEVLEDAERLVEADDRAVAIQAACAAVLADPDRASAGAVALLTAPVDDIAEAPSVHAGSLTQLIGRSLARLADEHRERAIEALALQHRAASPLERVSLTASLLSLAFRGQAAPAAAADLTPPQKRAVEAIRDYGAFTVNGASFANYCLLVREWGLPASADSLRNWLDGRETIPKIASRGPWWRFWRSRE